MLDALATGDVAIITDAGTPGISDPGYELIAGAIDAGIRVIALPGANAITTALIASGLPSDSFRFYGFPPRKAGELRAYLAARADFPETLIFYESPNRLIKTLDALREVFGDRQAVVGLELTKLFEEFARGTLSELIDHFAARADSRRGHAAGARKVKIDVKAQRVRSCPYLCVFAPCETRFAFASLR